MAYSHLEVVRQLLSACIARVHGDEHSTGRVQRDLCAFKYKSLDPLVDCHLDTVDLLGYHRQHLRMENYRKSAISNT